MSPPHSMEGTAHSMHVENEAEGKCVRRPHMAPDTRAPLKARCSWGWVWRWPGSGCTPCGCGFLLGQARLGVPILSSGCSQRKEEAEAGAGHCFRDIRAPVGTVCLLARLPVPPWIHCLLHSRAPQGLPRPEPCWGCGHKNQQTRDFTGQVVGEGTDPFWFK